MITSILNLFNACIDGELIRFTEGGQTHWAIIGIRNHERLMLLVLPLNSPPYCENILGAMDVLRPPYEAAPLLSYGNDYSIHINHAGYCDVGGRGTLIRAPGSYVITERDRYICCNDRVTSKIAYFDLESGAVGGEPGGLRAIFAEWELALRDEQPKTLLRVQASNP